MVANWVTNYCDVCIIYFAGEFKSWGISQGDLIIELCVLYRALQTPLQVVVTLRPNPLLYALQDNYFPGLFTCSALCSAGARH